MPSYRRVPSPKVRDMRQDSGDVSVEPAVTEAEEEQAADEAGAETTEESYRDLQARAREAGISPLNVSREELLAELGEGD